MSRPGRRRRESDGRRPGPPSDADIANAIHACGRLERRRLVDEFGTDWLSAGEDLDHALERLAAGGEIAPVGYGADRCSSLVSMRTPEKFPPEAAAALSILREAQTPGWVFPIPDKGRIGILMPQEDVLPAMFRGVAGSGLMRVRRAALLLESQLGRIEREYDVHYWIQVRPPTGFPFSVELEVRGTHAPGSFYQE